MYRNVDVRFFNGAHVGVCTMFLRQCWKPLSYRRVVCGVVELMGSDVLNSWYASSLSIIGESKVRWLLGWVVMRGTFEVELFVSLMALFCSVLREVVGMKVESLCMFCLRRDSSLHVCVGFDWVNRRKI